MFVIRRVTDWVGDSEGAGDDFVYIFLNKNLRRGIRDIGPSIPFFVVISSWVGRKVSRRFRGGDENIGILHLDIISVRCKWCRSWR